MSTFDFDDPDSPAKALSLPMMGLRDVVIFPNSIVPLFVGRESSINAIQKALAEHDKKIFLVTQRSATKDAPTQDDLFQVGTVSRILQMLRLPDGTLKVLFEGLYRATWTPDSANDFGNDEEACPLALTAHIPEKSIEQPEPEIEALVLSVKDTLNESIATNKELMPETILSARSTDNPGELADLIMAHLKINFTAKQAILENYSPFHRLEEVYKNLLREIELAGVKKQVTGRVKNQMEKNQRDYYLSEQVKAIYKEMGREDDPVAEVDELEKQLDAKNMSDENKERIRKELKKLRSMQPSSAEYAVARNYVDWTLCLPWGQNKKTELKIDQARNILDEDHYGLDKPKKRILEYLAVQSLVETMQGSILCLVGPPGVGKTSIAKSVARAMDREFVRLSLGGVRDEAEIRGHRRTYVGALPGKIIQALRRCEYNNPVLCLDEVDKVASDYRGDPASALLEVLDPEQNHAFNDHYLELDYDLSKIFFITTANTLESIPLPLQDRMEIIRLPGYLETEKKSIAEQFLLPKQRKQHGLTDKNISLSTDALLSVIRHYTKESGVRNLEREIASLCRKAAMQVVEQENKELEVNFSKESIKEYLGIRKYRFGKREASPQVGVTTGLAWTQTGGELLLVEAALMPGSGKIVITGKLGDVMQESAKAALSYIRSRSDLFGLKRDFYKDIDIHVHVPDGATPKDGPSAGITLTTALISALLNIPARNNLAMTGEITLRGRILPIGGLREKLLAAHRGLVERVLIPQDNEKDLADVPTEIKNDLEITLVEHMDEVLAAALVCDTEAIFRHKESHEPLANLLIKREEELSQTH